jgi:SAM-dependent methyltransferase
MVPALGSALLAAFPDAAVFGLDRSAAMVAQANRAAIDAGRLQLQRGDIADSASLAPLDLIVAVHVIYFWPDPVTPLSALRAALGPRGMLALGYLGRTCRSERSSSSPGSVLACTRPTTTCPTSSAPRASPMSTLASSRTHQPAVAAGASTLLTATGGIRVGRPVSQCGDRISDRLVAPRRLVRDLLQLALSGDGDSPLSALSGARIIPAETRLPRIMQDSAGASVVIGRDHYERDWPAGL